MRLGRLKKDSGMRLGRLRKDSGMRLGRLKKEDSGMRLRRLRSDDSGMRLRRLRSTSESTERHGLPVYIMKRLAYGIYPTLSNFDSVLSEIMSNSVCTVAGRPVPCIRRP